MKKILLIIFFSLLFFSVQQNNIIKICVAGEPDFYDIHKIATFHNSIIVRQFMGTLLDRDQNGKIIPYGVKAYKQVSSKKWFFELNDIKFSNGEFLKSIDVKYSLERIAKLNKKDFSTIKKVEIINSKKFYIITKIPDPLILNRLIAMGYVIPYSLVQKYGSYEIVFEKQMYIGFGPYKFVNWEKGKYIDMVKNPYYIKKSVSFNKIRFVFENDSVKRVKLFQNKNLDLITNVPLIYLSELIKLNNIKIVKGNISQYLFGNYNIKNDSPLQSLYVRKAINHAINRDKIIRIIEKGNAEKIPTIFVKEAFGYNKNLSYYKYDINYAKQLMEKSKYKSINLSMLVSSDIYSIAKAIKSDLLLIGINIEIEDIKRDEGIYEWLVTSKKKHDIFLLNPVDPMLHCYYHLETLILRFPHQELSEIESLKESIIHLTTISDLNKQKQILYNIQSSIYNLSLYMFLWQKKGIYVLGENVNILKLFPDGILRLEYIR